MNYDWSSESGEQARSGMAAAKEGDLTTLWGRLARRETGLDPSAVNAVVKLCRSAESASEFRNTWMRGQAGRTVATPRVFEAVSRPVLDVGRLPVGSFLIEFPFRLRQPYLSKDDVGLYVNENPVRKDRALGVPYVAGTSWKGCMAASMYRLGGKRSRSGSKENAIRLFGNWREEVDPDRFRAGRLQFFASYFPAGLAYHLINPHNRTTKTGKPIEIEMVPRGAESRFTLLYVSPVEGGPFGSQEADLRNSARVVGLTLTKYGFGAKTSSGYGVAEDKLPGPGVVRARRVDVLAEVRFGTLGELVDKVKELRFQ